jgi:hypothetical protein
MIADNSDESADTLDNTMKGGFAPESQEGDDEEFEQKLESIVTYIMGYLLEKIRKAKTELESGENLPYDVQDSFYENPSKKPNNSSELKEIGRYPEKEILKRYKD